ncbi:uncharacterized protein (TIGR03905 family) [Parabacteroides sp. PF5-5]|uniref:TIGR03905 family TSCPD domain-containing protein n=1 Tax=unclassified Parabacteroides TaxID=2649774 RepID=UPI0024745B71|nr:MULTISPECIES: TIGR03905 family TSCPD domain-containing protein [unclassified Parabacteroides]MDH6305807.1 uncharacterized protein (TIGR03905 family) [Parabacteroides sp. PH5-39]MDH6317756.1 uncharacterized protein (TIGR03905 family) [Parabacteroides sp. PF5-13]MDH6320587.1 uncharacterized protein (TIGR03905 family) [Parabacteroides sp. PH5-13]MDH6324250.1 uncharacterized protein (TIGR03905 family) [Parabacteroides sp. PH5-8]MDH6328941.1 uncharacterized protein (TIGR03905 family) [Parabacter
MSKKQYTYIPDAKVCSNKIIIDAEGDIIAKVEVIGGCSGNSQGIVSLLKGMNINEAIKRLEGISCGRKGTSCPDQIAQALKELSQ